MPAAKAKASKPRARLGDDVVAKAPRKGEPTNVVVARTEVVGGQVRLKVDGAQTVRGVPGGKLLVKHVYRLQESSRDKEEYRILLRSSLDGQQHPPSLARFGDNYAVTDDYSGFVVHEYKLPARGEARLDFEVGAEYTVGDWKATEVETHDLKQAKGQVTILLSI